MTPCPDTGSSFIHPPTRTTGRRRRGNVLMRSSSLSRRDRQPEIMDQPDLSPERHHQALAGLARINFLSGAAGSLFRPLYRLPQRLAAKGGEGEAPAEPAS